MPHCAAIGCNYQTKGKKISDVSMHCFPSEKKRRAEWEKACGRTQLPKVPCLCSRHFSPDAFDSFYRPQLIKELTGISGSHRRLKKNAVPTIFSHKAPKRPRLASGKRAEKRPRQATLDALPVESASDTSVDTEESDAEESDDSSVNVVLPSTMMARKRITTQDRNKFWALDIFQHWLETKGQAIDLATCEKAQLNIVLRHFYGSVRNSHGELYAFKSFHVIRAGLNRYITGPPMNRSLCLIKDTEFTSANRVFTSISDVMMSNACIIKDYIITYADMEKIMSSSAVDTSQPRGLLNKVWFDIQCHFGRRAMALQSDSFVRGADKNGVKYYTLRSGNTDTASGEERERGENRGSRFMFEKPGDSRCPVASLGKYLDRLPPDATAFYLRPKEEAPLPGVAWYENVPVGVKDLVAMLPRICQEAGTSKCFQNSSLQRTINQRDDLLGKGCRMPSLKKLCPLCHKSYHGLPWHLVRIHDIHNAQERALLVALASGTVKCQKEPCPVPACPHVDKDLIHHLETHWEVSWPDRQELLAQVKRTITIRMLAELRATDPKPPLRTNLDLEARPAHTAKPSRAELEERRVVSQKGRPRTQKRELDVMTSWEAKKARSKASISPRHPPQVVVVLEADPSSPPPDQRMLPDHIRCPNQLLAEDQCHAPGGVRRHSKANVRSAKPPGTSIPVGDGALLHQEPPSSHSEPLSEDDVLMMEASEGKGATQTVSKRPLLVFRPAKQLRIQLTPINISHFVMN